LSFPDPGAAELTEDGVVVSWHVDTLVGFEVEGDADVGEVRAQGSALLTVDQVGVPRVVGSQNVLLHLRVENEVDVVQPTAAQMAVTHDSRSRRICRTRIPTRIDLRCHFVSVFSSEVVAQLVCHHNEVPLVEIAAEGTRDAVAVALR
jgi:hypothetical protein